MSIKAITKVWARSKLKGSALLLMIAIADYAHDDGSNAFPSIESLAKKIRMSERNTQRLVQLAEESGELLVERGASRYGTNLYTIILCRGDNLTPTDEEGVTASAVRGDKSSEGGDNQRKKGVTAVSPDPSTYPSDLNSSVPTAETEKKDPAEDIWNLVKQDLSARVSATVFKDLFWSTRGVSIDGGTLIVHCSNQFQIERIRGFFSEHVLSAMRSCGENLTFELVQ